MTADTILGENLNIHRVQLQTFSRIPGTVPKKKWKLSKSVGLAAGTPR
jgi:hypothetical protein